MEQKDRKDMTASELLRWVADCADITCRKCREMGFGCDTGEASYCEQVWEHIADKIDAELAQARKEAVNESKKPMWWFRSAIKRGEDWPEPRDGEKFRDYLHRCFLPRPRFEDGEPVQMGDEIAICGGDIDVNEVVMLLDGSGYRLLHSTDVSASAIEDRVKRPAPEVLGADGLPIKAGETVWHVINGREATVANLKPWGAECDLADDICESVVWAYEMITHTPPDTQEKIDDDALKAYCDYWGCGDSSCADCPVMIDGKRPKHRYHVHDCEIAQMLDLLRRQRELDKRMGGE